MADDDQNNGVLEKEFEKIVKDCVEKSKTQPNRSSLIASIFYISVLLLIGLPIWYRTTTPERWSLPDISRLMVRSQTLTHYYKISIVGLESTEELFKNIDLRNYLDSNHRTRISFDNSLSFRQEWSVRYAFNDELSAIKSMNNHNDQFVLNELDQSLSAKNIQSINSIMFYILPKDIHTDRFLHVGRYRSYFIDLNHMNNICGQIDIVECLGEQINRQVHQVQLLVTRFYSHQADKQEQNIVLLMARDFDFLFDIIYEEDHIGKNLDLNERKNRHRRLIKQIDELLERFYTHRFSFSQYFRINFITQVLHYVFPSDNFIQSKLSSKSNSSRMERLLPLSSMDSILNRIETSRVEHYNDRSYHFVLYVRSSSLPKMKFFNEQNQNTSNLITTPFRGSILIVNDDEDLFNGFRQLIRSFLYLPDHCEVIGEFFTQLEIESIVHALVQKHIHETLKSLESIEKLLNKVSNMVIEEKIANRIHDSLEMSMKAAELLNMNGDISESYEKSWLAYSFSEQAFYDPSLLSLLYFPDDQKYAIYLPLFLPISIPLLHNIFHLFKMFKNRKTIENKDKQE
ncbi:GPI transamidase component PIG-S-like protein [Euroglyphus maynei]|uniref:GPI transamidase component PIG-S-like protein n=1 Tax=Euroglyphus maynei TaxID=6958 RepID=A0A1Y3APZ7_EURMA|nr:GPI transamidase component PIG-S-like protein [Euroglyphus maynei]